MEEDIDGIHHINIYSKGNTDFDEFMEFCKNLKCEGL